MKKQKFKLKPYQTEGVKWLLKNPASGLFFPPGLGKTLCVLCAIDILKSEKKAKSFLIVATRRIIYEVWPKEIGKWGFNLTYEIAHGDKKNRVLKSNADIVLLNYDGLPWFVKNNKRQFDVLVCDESTKIKNWTSKRFKSLKQILGSFKRRYILTGTPTPKSMMDLFSQIYTLDLGEALGTYITHYRHEYFISGGYLGYEWFLKNGSTERIYDRTKHLILRYDESVLDIEPLINNFIEIEMDLKVLKYYKDMEKTYVADIAGQELSAANAGVKTQKLRQIASGSVYNEAGKIVDIHDYKVQALLELIEELQGSPCLIGYEFRHERDKILKYLPDAAYIDGSVPDKLASDIVKLWNAGKLPYLLGQISSVAHGLNLQDSSNTVIYYSLTWNLEDYIQFYRRVWRQGQSKKVVVHHLVMKGTVDEDVLSVLKDKDINQNKLLNYFKQRVKL